MALLLLCVALAGCASVQGYPHDPEDEDATLSALRGYFAPEADQAYYAAADEATRRRLRDTIVLNRIRAYDIEFDSFAEALTGDRNRLMAGSDLVVLALNGVGATTGGAATKAALAAASAGVVGAQGAINKDLLYDRTVPALIAQMQANRLRVETIIIEGLASGDAAYPLPRAYLDLHSLKAAGGLPNAVSDITQQAVTNKAFAQAKLDDLRNVKFSSSASGQTITRWLFDSKGVIDPGRRRLLQSWIEQNVGEYPFESFVSASTMESRRLDAIRALHIN